MILTLKADVICPEEQGAKRSRTMLSRWHTLPPEAVFLSWRVTFRWCWEGVSKSKTPAAKPD